MNHDQDYPLLSESVHSQKLECRILQEPRPDKLLRADFRADTSPARVALDGKDPHAPTRSTLFCQYNVGRL
jgi:hypothetical protein